MTRAYVPLARNAPAVGHPPNAPAELGNDNEMNSIHSDPPQPHEAPDNAAEVQQVHDEPNEHVLEGPEGRGRDAVGRSDASGGAPVEPRVAVASGGA